MSEPQLRFNTTPYHGNHVGNILLHFREQGYAILPDVFEPTSVDAYLGQVQAALVPGEHGRMALPPSPLRIAPARTPRILQIVRALYAPAQMHPNVSIFEVAWLISAAEKPNAIVDSWHKDRDHLCATCVDGYQTPTDVHVGMYFTDMTPQHGPTQVIARSHRELKRSPFAGCEPDSFLCRKQDAVMWDQRLWHRATPRTVEGSRIFALFGYYPIPSYAETPPKMCPSQRQATLDAKDGLEQMLFGGLYPQV
jgi:hypothetical protein